MSQIRSKCQCVDVSIKIINTARGFVCYRCTIFSYFGTDAAKTSKRNCALTHGNDNLIMITHCKIEVMLPGNAKL